MIHRVSRLKYVWKNLQKLSLTCLLLGVIAQCSSTAKAPIYVKDGHMYGAIRGSFRDHWWNYYERGLSYAEGEYFKEATEDLTWALKQRDHDQRRARTYGMHFVDYFPRRELGVIYYLAGNLQEAKRQLEQSIADWPTAKASFYLDKTRKALLETIAGPGIGSSIGSNAGGPNLTLDIEAEEIWTRDDPVLISGTTADDQFITSVLINDSPLFQEGSQKEIRFSEPLNLVEGAHAVEVKSTNLMNAMTTRRLMVHVDRQGPVIAIESSSLDSKDPGQTIITGFVNDISGINSLIINGKLKTVNKAKEVAFAEQVPSHITLVELSTQDSLGNTTSAKIPIQGLLSSRTAPALIAAAVSDADSAGLLASTVNIQSDGPPTIETRGWDEPQTVYTDKIYLEGQAIDSDQIKSLAVNSLPILKRQGRAVFFSQLVALNPGKNQVVIEACDAKGHCAIKRIYIVRQIPPALRLQERLAVSVLPFDPVGTTMESARAFRENLMNEMVYQNRFRLVERDRIDLILREQKLGASELVNQDSALRLGRLVAAHCIMLGSIVRTSRGTEIIARVVDTETSEFLAIEDVYDEVKNEEALDRLAKRLSIKIHREFPLVTGIIIKQENKQIFTDLGEKKIRRQKKLLLFRDRPIGHPVSGKTIGSDYQIVGRATIQQSYPNMSRAELVDCDPATARKLDKVITQ